MAEIIAAAIAAIGVGYSVYAGETSKATATKARRRSKEAQDEALRTQMVERSRTAQTEANANRATPSDSVMTDALGAPTDRTGGVDDRLRLSRTTKLGGGGI